MKFYAGLLSILWLLRMAVSVWTLVEVPQPVLKLNHALDMVVLTLALAGAVQLAFGKVWLPRFKVMHWRIVSRVTLILGILSAMVYTRGEAVGVAASPNPGILNGLLIFLPYLLFAIPVIVLEHRLRTSD